MISVRRLFLAFIVLLGAVVHAQDNWQPFPQEQTAENLWSIAFGQRTLVVAGERGTILTYNYADQVWLSRYSHVSVWLVGAGYGAGRFIVVGDQGAILTSDDAGVTWTPRVSGTTTRLNAVAYGNGRWLAVGEQGVVLTSPDGSTWTQRPSLGSGFLRALAYGRGQFLVGGAGGVLYTTPDGATFARVAIETTLDIEGVAISDAHFWAVGSAGLRAVATQLGTWQYNTPRSIPGLTAPTLRGVAVRNTDEASAVGTFMADTYLQGSDPRWQGYNAFPRFLATAVVQGESEMVCVGFGGRVARALMSSPALLLASAGNFAEYGTDVRLRVTSGQALHSIQWFRGSTPLPGATSAEFVLSRIKPSDTGSYSVQVMTELDATPRWAGSYSLRPIPAGRPATLDPSFHPALPVLPTVMAFQPDGKILAGGSISVATGPGPMVSFVRLHPDGSFDPGFTPPSGISPTEAVQAIHLLADGRMYIRGDFTTLAGQSRPRLARLLANGALDLSFVPDPSLPPITGSALAPDGKLYVQATPQNPEAGGTYRLNADGSRDPSFEIAPSDRIVAIDAAGRVLLVRAVAGPPPTPRLLRLHRYLPDGSLDTAYTSFDATYSPVGWGTVLSTTNVAPDGALYFSTNYIGGHFGSVNTFSRLLPNGGYDGTYLRPPPSDYPATPFFSFAYRADGGLWQIRGNGWPTRARSFARDGAPDPTRYATLPDYASYYISAIAPDGSLLAYNYFQGDSSRVNVFRVRPIVGRAGRLTNLSVRAFVPSSDAPLIAGFVTAGTGDTSAVVRGVGPSLTQFGVTDAMSNPALSLRRDSTEQATNDNWNAALAPRFIAVGAFPLNPGSTDAALEAPIGAGNYSALIGPAGSGTGSGTALVELFESTETLTPPRRFVNVSARAAVTPGRPLIVGFAITGEVPVTLLIRGIGPTLANFGVGNPLSDPRLTLYRNGAALWENSGGWFIDSNLTPESTPDIAAARSGAFTLPTGSRDAAMVVVLPPGTYSAVVDSVGNTTGNALVEVYEVP